MRLSNCLLSRFTDLSIERGMRTYLPCLEKNVSLVFSSFSISSVHNDLRNFSASPPFILSFAVRWRSRSLCDDVSSEIVLWYELLSLTLVVTLRPHSDLRSAHNNILTLAFSSLYFVLSIWVRRFILSIIESRALYSSPSRLRHSSIGTWRGDPKSPPTFLRTHIGPRML